MAAPAWISLLPEEYQNDVYGISWSIILLTVVFGVLLIWVLMWHSSVSKQISRERHLISTTEELQTQLQAIIVEKLDTEKGFKELLMRLEQLKDDFEEESASRAKTQEDYVHLEEIVKSLRDDNETKVTEIKECHCKLKEFEKEKISLMNKSKQFQKQMEEQKLANSDLEKQVMVAFDELEENKNSKIELENKLKDCEKRLNKKEKVEERLEKKLKGLEDQANDLKQQVCQLEEQLGSERDENQITKQEADVLKDCLLQLQGVRDALAENGDEELESEELNEKQKDKLKTLIDVSHMQMKLKHVEIEKGRIMLDLEAEKKSREETEARVGELEAEQENIKGLLQKTERDLQVQQAKLNVMQEFYTKREVEMQGKLGKEVTVREMKESRLAEESDRISILTEQLEVYKKMNEESKQQFAENDKQRKQEISQFEKKAHSNWLATREAERKFDEAQREMTQMRMELQDLQQRLHEAENREPILLRPRPLPPPGPFGPPPFRDTSPPVRMGGRRSPVGSLHSEIGPSDRSPRPQSQGHPPAEPIEVGDGAPPRMFAPRRGSHQFKDPSRRDGPSPFLHDPMFDGPTPIRGPFIPRAGAPPFRPMRDGPPSFHDDLPMMLDNRPPLRERPLFSDGPLLPPTSIRPPVRPGLNPTVYRSPSVPPPTMYDVSPGQNSFSYRAPRSDAHFDPMNSSAYIDRSGPPKQDQSARPSAMPLHGNHPHNSSSRSNYDIHSVQGAV